MTKSTSHHTGVFPVYLLFALCVGFSSLQAQSTLEDIQTIFSTNCTFSSCHSGSSPAGALDLSGSTASLYTNLVGRVPTNPAAADRGYLRVDAGFPENSFLLHKVARSAWDDEYGVGPGEGSVMPTSDDLTLEEQELIRQWILYGAPESDQVVDPSVLADYYGGMGAVGVPKPEPPASGEGFQIRLGPFFLAPGQEVEYFYKRPVSFDGPTEVTRTNVFFNEVSHHFILYKYNSLAAASLFRSGLREIEEPGATPDASVNIVAAWQDAYDIDLPPGSAYFWNSQEVLDMNFHLYNASMDSVLPCEVYVNIYTRPRDESQPTIQMFSQIIPIDAVAAFSGAGFIGQSLIIPGDGATYEFTDHLFIPLPTPPVWHLWFLSSHTHSRGVDYDIYNRATGEQIFEGFYNVDYTFNQGYYDWEHPPVRYFDPFYPIGMGLTGGITHKAKYVNNTGSTITWGDRTTDEMMLFFIQYTTEPLPEVSSIDEPVLLNESGLNLFPNPFRDRAELSFRLPVDGQVSIEVMDAMGRRSAVLYNGWMGSGMQRISIPAMQQGAGLYTVVIRHEGQQFTRKLIQVD